MKNLVRATGAIACAIGAVGLTFTGINAATTPFEEWPDFESTGERLGVTYSYFTHWSNILGTIVAYSYARGSRNPRLAFLRIDAVVMLIITGLIYNVLLAKNSTPVGIEAFTNPIVHMAMPILIPLLWLLDRFIATKGDVNVKNAFYALAIPALWAIFTLYRGDTTGGYYPYDFVNITNHGTEKVLKNIAGVGVLFLGLTAIMGLVEEIIIRKKQA